MSWPSTAADARSLPLGFTGVVCGPDLKHGLQPPEDLSNSRGGHDDTTVNGSDDLAKANFPLALLGCRLLKLDPLTRKLCVVPCTLDRQLQGFDLFRVDEIL